MARSVEEGDEAPVEFRWVEEYESREAIESDEHSEVREGLREPLKDRTIDGTVERQGV